MREITPKFGFFDKIKYAFYRRCAMKYMIFYTDFFVTIGADPSLSDKLRIDAFKSAGNYSAARAEMQLDAAKLKKNRLLNRAKNTKN